MRVKENRCRLRSCFLREAGVLRCHLEQSLVVRMSVKDLHDGVDMGIHLRVDAEPDDVPEIFGTDALRRHEAFLSYHDLRRVFRGALKGGSAHGVCRAFAGSVRGVPAQVFRILCSAGIGRIPGVSGAACISRVPGIFRISGAFSVSAAASISGICSISGVPCISAASAREHVSRILRQILPRIVRQGHCLLI